MSYRYCEAFAEVDYILTGLKESERMQIPKSLLDVIHERKAKNYEFHIDLSKSLFEQNLKNETLAVLALIYRKYLSNAEEKEFLERRYQETLKEPEMINVKRSSTKVSNIEKNESPEVSLCKVEKASFFVKLKSKWTEIRNRIKKTVK